MKDLIRICLFFPKRNMTISLRRFFESQPNGVVTDFFTDSRSLVRDITASRPHLVILQNTVVTATRLTALQSTFPYTVFATWVDSRLNQNKMDELMAQANEKLQHEFSINHTEVLQPHTQAAGRSRQAGLTSKESLVLQLLADGKSYQTVCTELLIGYETLRTHMQHIYAKLGVTHVNEAVALARRKRMIK